MNKKMKAAVKKINSSCELSFFKSKIKYDNDSIIYSSNSKVLECKINNIEEKTSLNGTVVVNGIDSLSYFLIEMLLMEYSVFEELPKRNFLKNGIEKKQLSKLNFFYEQCYSREDYISLIMKVDVNLSLVSPISKRESVDYGSFINGKSWPVIYDQMDYIDGDKELRLNHIERGRNSYICSYSSWRALYLCRLNYWLQVL